MFALMHFGTTIDSNVELTRAFSPYINYEQDRDLKIKIVFVSVVYSLLLALGALTITDTAKPAPMPVDGAISLVVNNTSNNKIYQNLKNITDETDVRFYKSYIDDQGKLSYYNLSDYHQGSLLDKVNANGMIYKSGTIPAKSLNQLQVIGVRVITDQSYPWYLGGILQFNSQLRSFYTTLLFLGAFIGIFICDVKSLKARMIRLSLGRSIVSLPDILKPTAILIVIATTVGLLYAATIGHGFQTFSTQLLIALMVTDFIIFLLLLGLSLILIAMMIHLEKPIAVIKNKSGGKSIFVIWLLLIGMMTVAVGSLNQQYQNKIQQLSTQINHLKPWYSVKDWQKTQPFVGHATAVNGKMTEPAPSQQDVDLVKKIGSQSYIYIAQTTAVVPKFLTGEIENDFAKQLSQDGITAPDLNRKVWYLNNGAMHKQAFDKAYPYDPSKSATLYLPQKYRDKAQSLINTIYVEQLREVHLSKNDIEVQIVPENQTVFLYREMATRFAGDISNQEKDFGSLRQQILVRLNDTVLLAHNDKTFANNILNTMSLLSPQAIKIISQENDDLTNQTITPFQTVSLNVIALKHQLAVAKFLQVIIFSALILSMIFYLNTIYQFEIISVVKKKILGLSIFQVYGPYSLSLVIMMVIAYAINMLLGQANGLTTLALVSGLIVTIITTLIVDRKIGSDYTQILKGDNI